MTFDFSDLRPQKKGKTVVDPIALFQGLRVTDTSINDLWLAQGDALRDWHSSRKQQDVAISLNTGAGKTLVGLLVAQSLVNETRGLVLYACSSIQLVLQTEKKAEGYGLPITTYIGGKFSNELAHRGEAACVTTYQALFNGKSVFFRREVAAVIFDDAHTAEHLLRDHFSLQINKTKFPALFQSLCAEFRDYFHAVGNISSFEEITKETVSKLLLVHPSEVKRSAESITRSFLASEVPRHDDTTFAWTHLKDHLDICAFIFSASGLTVTPAFVPVKTLPYFSAPDIRRVYLSATLNAPDVFVRTFGRRPSRVIAPNTTAGECERMILIPLQMKGSVDELVATKEAIKTHKALVLCPSSKRAQKWSDIAPALLRDDMTNAIEQFKSAAPPAKIVLTARYDGIDLPGDMCRVVVIDDLPSGTGPVERFLWEYLRISATLRTAVACRVVQSFGRISRGMSDHGVAILTGRQLVDWIQVPRNFETLPVFLQKQIQLGRQMSEKQNRTNLPGLVQSCIGRDKSWVQAYENFIREADVDEAVPLPETGATLAEAEANYAASLWRRDFASAAQSLQKTFDLSADFSLNTHYWHKLWTAFALECDGDIDTARSLYRQAHIGQANIPRLKPTIEEQRSAAVSEQAVRVALNFDVSTDGRIRPPRNLDKDLQALKGGASSAQTEEALRALGQYLGLQSTRPEREHGTGPDVLWLNYSKVALCADVKSNKDTASVYRKEELGQLSDHVQWVRNNYEIETIIPIFIGPESQPSETANPPEDVLVCALEKLAAVAESLVAVYRDIASNALPLTVTALVDEQFSKRALYWNELITDLKMKPLKTG